MWLVRAERNLWTTHLRKWERSLTLEMNGEHSRLNSVQCHMSGIARKDRKSSDTKQLFPNSSLSPRSDEIEGHHPAMA